MNLSQLEICQDDAEIKALLVAHGKQTHLIPRPGFPGPFRNHVVWSSDGMLYVVTHYHGYLLPSDNGFMAMRIPVDSNPPETMSRIVNEFIENGQAKSGPCYSDIVKDEIEVN